MKKGLPPALTLLLLLALACAANSHVGAQVNASVQKGDGNGARRPDIPRSVRSVTIPVTLRLREERPSSEELRTVNFIVTEDGERQEILSTRSAADRAPLALTLLIQDDLVSSVGLEISGLANFIRRLPQGSLVQVGYLRAGSLQLRQKFTTDLERAAKALRIPIGAASAAPYNPYVQIYDSLKRYGGVPLGTRRAVLVISDGLDLSHGFNSSSPSQSVDLERAINEAQRRSVAIYGIYAPTVGAGGNTALVGNAQGSLARLTQDTGGKAFFQGSGAPVSFDPFLRQLSDILSRQFALTYLSTHAEKGFHRIKIEAPEADAEISHPSGYTRK
jgi:VWFA-related protein